MKVGTEATLSAYVTARAVEISGEQARSARLFADLARADPANLPLARRAIVTAMQSGDTALAASLAKRMPQAELGFDGRMLLVADALRSGKERDALTLLQAGKTTTESNLVVPLVEAWVATKAGRDDGEKAMAALSADSALAATGEYQRINMLLALKRADEALPLARAFLANRKDGITRQRLALASGFARLGKMEAVQEMLDSEDGPVLAAKALLAKGDQLPLGIGIDSAADGVADLLLNFAVELGRNNDRGLPLALARIAGHANPDNRAASILAALFLDGAGQTDDALASLRTVKPGDLFAVDAVDLQARLLSEADRNAEALALIAPRATAVNASVDELSRYGDILGEMKRHGDAAAAYAQAIDRARGTKADVWALHLLRAASLEEADRWPEAKVELETAMKLQPDNPLILNYLGYGKLERGEDLDQAEAMIRKASAMRPDDASITDSLGWALYKRGNLDEAIDTLTRAATSDPAQSEIREHLGDALYRAGRRIEARFSWNAALVTAEDEAKGRLEAKLDGGLNQGNAAP